MAFFHGSCRSPLSFKLEHNVSCSIDIDDLCRWHGALFVDKRWKRYLVNLPGRPLSRVGSFARQIRTSRLRAGGYRETARWTIHVNRLGVSVDSWISEAIHT